MAAASQKTRRDFIEGADWLKKQNAEDAYGGVFYNGLVRGEETGEKAVEQDDCKNRNRAADRG